jgi:hypothetical protein
VTAADIERRVRVMAKAERRAVAHGWRRLGSCWLHPVHGERGPYSLAAAIRVALAEAEP